MADNDYSEYRKCPACDGRPRHPSRAQPGVLRCMACGALLGKMTLRALKRYVRVADPMGPFTRATHAQFFDVFVTDLKQPRRTHGMYDLRTGHVVQWG